MTRFRVVFVSNAESDERWAEPLRAALPEDELHFEADAVSPEAVDVVLTAAPPPGALARYTRLKLIQSIWMGVETLVVDPTLPRDVPLARMIDPSMTRAMVESAAAHVLNAHLRLDDFARQQRASRWKLLRNPTTDQRTVGILGMGELGRAVAETLLQLGFRVRGWSRTRREVERVESFAGDAALPRFLSDCEILVVLIPLTPQTAGMIDASLLARLPEGAVLINLARGGVVRDDDLLAALDSGRLRHAVLDVFNVEPLPPGHRFWSHARVTVTPHVAALTNPQTAAGFVAENLRRLAAREPLLGLVDRARGY
jgi:glyoxylate/hydroxypyruvate reductase A